MSPFEKIDPDSPHYDLSAHIAVHTDLYRQAREAERRPPPESYKHLPHGRLLMTSAERYWEGKGLRVPVVEKRRPTEAERLAALSAMHGETLRRTAGTPQQQAAQQDFIAAYLAMKRDQDQLDQQAARAQATKADLEIGGHKLKASLRSAHWALDSFGDPDLYDYLDESGLAKHPGIFRLFKRVGGAYKDDPRTRRQPWTAARRPIE